MSLAEKAWKEATFPATAGSTFTSLLKYHILRNFCQYIKYDDFYTIITITLFYHLQK
jgi:hypothetical protein